LRAARRAGAWRDVSRRRQYRRTPAGSRPIPRARRGRRPRAGRALPAARLRTSPGARSGGGVQFPPFDDDRDARERPAPAGLGLSLPRAARARGADSTRGLPEGSMALTAAEIIKADQEHLIHPLHHPIDHAEPMIYVRGKGATIETF